MAGGRPRKYADIQDANAARRAHRQARSAQNGINALTSLPRLAGQLPGAMVWEVNAPPLLAVPSIAPDQSIFLDTILPYTEVEPTEDVIGPEGSDSEGRLVVDEITAETASQASVSMEISEPSTPRSPSGPSVSPSVTSNRRYRVPRRLQSLPRPHRSTTPSPAVGATSTAPLPATPAAHFLATQFLSDDPVQTLLELTQHAPGDHTTLLARLSQRQSATETPSTDRHIGLRAGLEHIQSHFAVDQIVPDIISKRSIETPEVIYTAEELQYLFAGYTCEADRCLRPSIDPLVETVSDYGVTHEYDIDSLVILSQHLGLFRQGILWYPSQMPLGALTTGMHLKSMVVRYEDSHGHHHENRVPIHHIPNYCFGRLPGADGFTIHYVFPQLYQPSTFTVAEKEGQRLTDQQFQRWTDRILLPSLGECLPPTRLQHLPSSFRHAQHNARALFVETRTAAVTAAVTAAAHHQNLQYELPATYLPAIQEAISRRVEEPGNHLFRGAHIVVVGKGLKLQPWKTASWASTMDYFFPWFESRFHAHYLNEDAVHVDVGKETMPPPGHTLLWQEDFLRLFAASLQVCTPHASTLKPTLYPWGFVRGVGSATLETPLESTLRDQGVSYIQHYGSFKEIFAAGNTYPFSNAGLSNLTLSPEVLATLQQVGGAISVRPEVLARAYISSKLRSHHGLWASASKSFGTRWECRMTLGLLRQIDQCARQLSPSVAQFDSPAQSSWVAHPTETLVEWYRHHMNKFCFGFETIYGRCREKPYIAWEHTQLMILMLKCISCFSGVLIPGTYPQLWLNQYQPRSRRRQPHMVEPQAPRQGLGIGDNMQECGYGWLADKIDWQNLVLRPEVSGQFRVQNVSILNTFRSQYRRLRNNMDDYVLVASSVSLLSRWKESSIHVAFIMRLFRAICLRVFLRDVFEILRPYIHLNQWSDITKGKVGLSADTLDRIAKHDQVTMRLMVTPHQRIRNFHGLFQWLWGKHDTFSRGAWGRLPYRMIYLFCGQIVTDVLGREHYRVWRSRFSKHVRINCWLLPYPSGKSLVSHEREDDGRVQFRWWSNYNYKVAQFLGENQNQVIQCQQWTRWPAGRWSVTPETDIMRGLPRPDIQLAFLRSEQVVQQLEDLGAQEGGRQPENVDEDEDGIDAECLRDEHGERGLGDGEGDSARRDGARYSSTDSDDSELSEYEDRRRLRLEEKIHETQQGRLGLLRRSLRIEQQAFQKSIPKTAQAQTTTGEDDDDDGAIEVPSHEDIDRILQRYEERLARVDEETLVHRQARLQLSRHRRSSEEQARSRQLRRIQTQLAFEARARVEEERRQRELAQAQADQDRRAQEEEHTRVQAELLRLQRAAVAKKDAARQEKRRIDRERRLWLTSARNQVRTDERRRRILGELSMADYPEEDGAVPIITGPR